MFFFQIKKQSSDIGLKMIYGVQSYVYFHIKKREDWHTMISVVDKLVKEDYNCLEAICFVFMLENLILKFHQKKYETKQAKKQKKTH